MTSTTAKPIQIHIPPALTPFTIPLSTFLTRNPAYTNLALDTFIFTRTHPKKLLLVQRAATERGFPNKWEIPGGSAEADDPTILHSAARETFEETGLHLTQFLREVGERVEFTTGRGGINRWLKLSFEIEVQELEEERGEAGEVPIRLDPAEHQAFAWVEEGDMHSEKYDIITPEQRALMLTAFELGRRGD